jgi:hypothetical protein
LEEANDKLGKAIEAFYFKATLKIMCTSIIATAAISPFRAITGAVFDGDPVLGGLSKSGVGWTAGNTTGSFCITVDEPRYRMRSSMVSCTAVA